MRFPRIALGAVACSILLSPLQRELYCGDETKYAQVIREMRAGSFFLPTLEGTLFTHKPPLHFWLVDLLTYPFGVYSIWPFVLPSILAFALLLWILHRWAGPVAAFVAGTSLLLWGSAQTARMDVEFTTLITFAAWQLSQRKRLYLAGTAIALATLIKGPMAPVMFVCIYILSRFAGEDRRRFAAPGEGLPPSPDAPRILPPLLPIPTIPPALLPMLTIPLLWLIPALLIGGDAFAREVLYKQTVRRAVGAWVHQSPPWFYLERAPLTLFPWFLLFVVALIAAYKRRDHAAKFAVSWILAVVVPYSLISSKLDVYMMALLPPVALVIARLFDTDDIWTRRGHIANIVMLVLFALIGVAALFVRPSQIKGPESAIVSMLNVKMLFVLLALAAVVALVLARTALVSTIGVGLTLIAALSYAAVALVPLANEIASPKPLIHALATSGVPADRIALYSCPHLWSRSMPRELEKVHYARPETVLASDPRLIVTARKHAAEIAPALESARPAGELRMIGKWFDVYER